MPWHPSPLRVTKYAVAQEGEARPLPAVVSVAAPSAIPVARPHLGPPSTHSAVFLLSSPSIVAGPCSLLPSLSVSRLVFDDISVLRGPARNCSKSHGSDPCGYLPTTVCVFTQVTPSPPCFPGSLSHEQQHLAHTAVLRLFIRSRVFHSPQRRTASLLTLFRPAFCSMNLLPFAFAASVEKQSSVLYWKVT